MNGSGVPMACAANPARPESASSAREVRICGMPLLNHPARAGARGSGEGHVLVERHLAQAGAGGGEDRVGECCRSRWHGWLADAADLVGGLKPAHLDFRALIEA